MGKLKVIIGIDIGVTGAIAVVDRATGVAIDLFGMPVIRMELSQKRKNGEPKVRTIYDEQKIKSKFIQLQQVFEITAVCIERPIAIPRQTILTAASSFEGFGFLKGLMEGLWINYGTVMPAAWTKTMLGSTPKNEGEISSQFKKRKKAGAIKEAKRIYPEMRNKIGTNDNFADALLIARWKIIKSDDEKGIAF